MATPGPRLLGGQLWEPSDQGLPGPVTAVAVDWSNPDVVYAGTPDGIFVSPDGAATWRALGLSQRSVSGIVQSAANPEILFAVTDAGLFRTDDGGTAWFPLATPFAGAAVYQIAIAPSDPATIYAATDIGIFRSRDGGESWLPLGINPRVPRAIYRATQPE